MNGIKITGPSMMTHPSTTKEHHSNQCTTAKEALTKTNPAVKCHRIVELRYQIEHNQYHVDTKALSEKLTDLIFTNKKD